MSLSLTACAGVAVLGARRPGVGAWNFVVAGLLAVFLLPLANGFGVPRLHAAHLLFLGAALLVSFLNYLPTRLGPAAFAAAVACSAEFMTLCRSDSTPAIDRNAVVVMGLMPWIGWICWAMKPNASTAFDATWRTFRDRFGWLWTQRMRDQFNRAVVNGGYTAVLVWTGLKRPSDEKSDELLAILHALLKRFGNDD